jgi:hypothetical protein
MIGMRALHTAIPVALPMSVKARAMPLRLSLTHLWISATTGAQQAEWPMPANAKKRLALLTEEE